MCDQIIVQVEQTRAESYERSFGVNITCVAKKSFNNIRVRREWFKIALFFNFLSYAF